MENFFCGPGPGTAHRQEGTRRAAACRRERKAVRCRRQGLPRGAGARPGKPERRPVSCGWSCVPCRKNVVKKVTTIVRGRDAPKKEDIWTTADAIACVALVAWPWAGLWRPWWAPAAASPVRRRRPSVSNRSMASSGGSPTSWTPRNAPRWPMKATGTRAMPVVTVPSTASSACWAKNTAPRTTSSPSACWKPTRAASPTGAPSAAPCTALPRPLPCSGAARNAPPWSMSCTAGTK